MAKVAIPLGSKIIPEQIMVVQFPKESTPDGAFDSAEKLAGRVAVVNIAAREPITEARLAPEGTAGWSIGCDSGRLSRDDRQG